MLPIFHYVEAVGEYWNLGNSFDGFDDDINKAYGKVK